MTNFNFQNVYKHVNYSVKRIPPRVKRAQYFEFDKVTCLDEARKVINKIKSRL